MRLIIAGSRELTYYPFLRQEMDEYLKGKKPTIISGLARGADILGTFYAQQRGLVVEGFAAEWGKYGRSAGIKRNKIMAKNASHLIAFWNGKSKGTSHMIDFALETGLDVTVVQYDAEFNEDGVMIDAWRK